MKNAVLGVLVGVGLTAAVTGWQGLVGQVHARSSHAMTEGRGLIAFCTPLDEQRQQVTVIDPVIRTLGVYYVDRQSGKIKLTSVRNFNWDLQMLHFNAETPLPQEIRSMVEQN